ncbi:Sec-independent protein translocase protein TatB [Thiomicrospira sp. ALE5]|uniref:Sec-independent protein translocase protein TatB n=1 Tax=Thiomicrospira sp. ALE5 TaxID=748650 RepID=UPI0008EC7E33|nr:Sec-independent protein translocase protein TatB [Thiomicrospira sp. ALE5]SFR55347.1 sec-independent protein translocase protein TatB [Thiomicrospira sp. ALE5]
MFDMGFLEIAVILVITLLVVGPERMPEVARKAGQMIAKARNFINSVKEDSDLKETVRELQQAVDLKEEKKNFDHIRKDLMTGFDDIKDQVNFDDLQRPFDAKSLTEPPSAAQREHASKQLESTDDVPTETAADSTSPSTRQNKTERE